MTDSATEVKFPKGTAVIPNNHFHVQFPRAGVCGGRVIGYPRWGRGVIVKWDTRKTPQALHIDYVSVLRTRRTK